MQPCLGMVWWALDTPVHSFSSCADCSGFWFVPLVGTIAVPLSLLMPQRPCSTGPFLFVVDRSCLRLDLGFDQVQGLDMCPRFVRLHRVSGSTPQLPENRSELLPFSCQRLLRRRLIPADVLCCGGLQNCAAQHALAAPHLRHPCPTGCPDVSPATFLTWVEAWLSAFGRSLMLFYILACGHLLCFSCRLGHNSPVANCCIRASRQAFRGAPLWLAFGIVAHLMPVCASMPPHLSASDSSLLAGSARPAVPLSVPPDLGFLEGVLPDDATFAGAIPMPPDPQFVAEVFRFQSSSCFREVWIDKGDTVGFLRITVQDELFGPGEDRVVPVVPQPQHKHAVFLDAPEWMLGRLAMPVLFEVQGASRCLFVEVFVGVVDFDTIRLALGRKWPVGGKIFVGHSMAALRPGDIANLHPGILVRVFPPRVAVHRCTTLERKMAEPSRWFQPFDPDSLADSDYLDRHVGLVGTMGDWDTIPATALSSTASLKSAIEERCGCHEAQFMVTSPDAQPPDLFFRGDRVVSTLAVLPRAASGSCVVFLDARDLGIPASVLLLTGQAIQLENLLRLAGGDRPYGCWRSAALHVMIRPRSASSPFTRL